MIGLFLEIALFLRLTGEVGPDTIATAGARATTIALGLLAAGYLAHRRRYWQAASVGGLTLAVGLSAGVTAEYASAGIGLVPLLWLPVDGAVIYVALAAFVLLKSEFFAGLLPALATGHLGNIWFLIVAGVYILLRPRVSPEGTSLVNLCCRLILGILAAYLLTTIGVVSAALPAKIWSESYWRLATIALLVLASGGGTTNPRSVVASRLVVVSFSCGLLLALLSGTLTKQEISTVFFDDSHGPWERTDLPLSVEEWGRDTLYNYRRLFDFQSQLGLRAITLRDEHEFSDALSSWDPSAILVLKTPMTRFSSDEMAGVRDWVARGGFALLISDHTDLFGMTQRLNQLADPGVLRFDATATFDRRGLLNRPITTPLEALLGAPAPIGTRRHFQTGTSFSSVSPFALAFLKYGASYAEQADYASTNHFGDFRPALSSAYRNFSALVFIPSTLGRGAWVGLGDSTPWSNFSFALPGYTTWWCGIVALAEYRRICAVSGVAGLLLGFSLAGASVLRSRSLYAAAIGLLGWCLGTGLLLHLTALSLEPPRTSELQVGSATNLEFLPAMRPPEQRSVTALLAMLGRIHRLPAIRSIGAPTKGIREVLVVNPADDNWGDLDVWREFVVDGGHLILLDDPERGGLVTTLVLLRELGLDVVRTPATYSRFSSVVDSAPSIYTSRIEARAVGASDDVKEGRTAADGWQVFQIGAGTVSLHFRSSEFSDDFVGDIWAGKTPGTLASRSFRGLALVLGESLLEPSAGELPRVALGDSYNYRTIPSHGPAKDGHLEVACDKPFNDLDALGRIWCDTRGLALHPELAAVWREEKPNQWITNTPLLLGNGEDYLGRFTAQDGLWQQIEWVHDSTWGGEASHRIVFQLAVAQQVSDD